MVAVAGLIVGMGLVVGAWLAAVGPFGSDPGSAERATVRVSIEDCGRGRQVATAFAVSDQLLVSAAHPLSQAEVVRIVVDDGPVEVNVVHLDAERDIAVFAIRSGPALTDWIRLTSDSLPDDGSRVDIVTVDEERTIRQPASVVRSVFVTLDGEGRRRALEVEAGIERGDSGAPVVDTEGLAVGMVFATARAGERGWAVAAEELQSALNGLEDEPQPVELAC